MGLSFLAGIGPTKRIQGADQAAMAPLARETTDGFAVPQEGHRFEFPRDHGSHPSYKIEWWYLTGHLFGQQDRRFGFQATFFRRAGPKAAPAEYTPQDSQRFGRDQIYLAHMALLDVPNKVFLHQERLEREGWNATASTERLDLNVGDWSLTMEDPMTEQMILRGGIRAEASFTLRLRPTKPLVVFGEKNVSRKAADPTAASYYLTFTRLGVEGQVQMGETSIPVEGQAWMDHEISSSQLSKDQAGWDWASVQLNDGREMMVYQLRRKDGSKDPFSTLAWVDPSGNPTHLKAEAFSWNPVGSWTSPKTGARYPLPVVLTAPDPARGRPVTLRLEPLALDQELTGDVGGIAYWEGACRVLDDTGKEVGSAFLELTGYAGDLAGRFQ